MKKFWEKFLKFLRDPAIQTILTLLTLVGVGIWGIIQGWLARLVAWLMKNSPWPNWLSLSLGILIVFLGGYWITIKFRKTQAQSKPNGMTYHEVWGVLWGWPPIGNHYVGDGPLCPKHRLPVDVIEKDFQSSYWFEFFCPGGEGEKGHVIKGPKVSQLVGSEGKSFHRDANIFKDVNSRLRAKVEKIALR